MDKRLKYNWENIQKEYDSGLSFRELIKKFGMAMATLAKAVRNGRLKTRSRSQAMKLLKIKSPQKHTEETKQKISKARIDFLKNHPNKVPYLLNHSSKRSYPEIIFEKALISSDITGWIASYQMSVYQYDFAFPKLKIDIEIDGSTHLLENVKKIDLRRDEWTRNNGWTIIRFTAKKVKEDVVSCINELKKIIQEKSLNQMEP